MNNEELLGDHKESSEASLVELGDVRELSYALPALACADSGMLAELKANRDAQVVPFAE